MVILELMVNKDILERKENLVPLESPGSQETTAVMYAVYMYSTVH